MDKTLYTTDSIESLSPLEFTRLRPGVYAGDTTYSTQLLVEIFSNSVDEYRLGHGQEINVTIQSNPYRVTVQDNGQGFISNSFRDDGKTILEAAFSVLNTSGKYHEDGAYEGTSLGSFGIGSKITTFLAHDLIVTNYRDNIVEQITFIEGVFDNRKVWKEKHPSGVTVSWTPSEEFFTNVEVNLSEIRQLFKTISCLCPKLIINLTVDNKTEQFVSERGLVDLFEEKLGDKEIINRRLEIHYEEDKYKLDLLMSYSSNYNMTIIPYINTGLTESGPHITALKTAITREMNKFFAENNLVKDKLTGDDLQEGLFIVFNATVPSVSYDSQVKSKVVKIDFKKISDAFVNELKLWMQRNTSELKIIAEKAVKAKKAREAAKRARENARGTKETKKNKFLTLPTKLVDAWSDDRSSCELLICEGDSAASGLISGRNSEFQAVFPVRGKVLNCYKATSEKIFANQEIANIVKAIGLQFDATTRRLIYDENRLRYDKICIAVDADSDGQAIANLLITCFWWLCPDLVINGHLYKTIPPLFRVTNKKNEYVYLKDKRALDEYAAMHPNEKYTIARNKGLGESDADELEECLLNPETRNMKQLIVEDVEATAELIEIFQGKDANLRKSYIEQYGEEANDL